MLLELHMMYFELYMSLKFYVIGIINLIGIIHAIEIWYICHWSIIYFVRIMRVFGNMISLCVNKREFLICAWLSNEG